MNQQERLPESAFASFRLNLGTSQPSVVTELLGVAPTLSWATGQEYAGKERDAITRSWRPVTRVRPWGVWIISTKGIDLGPVPEPHILHLLELLEPKHEYLAQVRALLNAGAASFYVRYETENGAGSYTLPTLVLSRLALLSDFVEWSFIKWDSEESMLG